MVREPVLSNPCSQPPLRHAWNAPVEARSQNGRPQMDPRVRIVSLLQRCTPPLPLTLLITEELIKNIVSIGAFIILSIRIISEWRHIHVADYKGYDLDASIQFVGTLARELKDSGLTNKSATARTPLAASITATVEPLQTSATSPSATRSDSSSQATDDDVESIFDDISDCKN